MIHVEGLSTATPEVYSSALQAGDYDVIVQAASPETSSKGSQGLKLEYVVENGPDQTYEKRDGTVETQSPVGRHLFETAWLPHSGQKDGGDYCARHLAKICEVLGVQQGDDLDEQEFIGKRCKVRVKVVTKDGEGNDLNDPRNEVTKRFEL